MKTVVEAWSKLASGILSRLGWLILHLGFAGSGRAYGPLSFWFLWQWLTEHYYRLRVVRPGGMLRYCIRTYQGPQLELADGTTVVPGDRILELHVDNAALAPRLAAVDGDGRIAAWTWLAMRGAAEDLAVLAAPGRLGAEVKAIRGVTLLARGAPRLGFEVRALPRSRWNALTRFFMVGLFTIYNPEGRQRVALERATYPAEIWMGRQTLASRYQQPGQGEP